MVLASSSLILAAGIANADTPAPSHGEMHYARGVAVAPAAANTYYESLAGGLQSGSIDADLDPRLEALAEALQGDPQVIDTFVREHIRTMPQFGLQKGDIGAYLDRSGTPFDQAQLFVSLVRAAGGQARFVYGEVSLSTSQARQAFGLRSNENPADALADGGVPVVDGGSSVRFSHVWVEVNEGAGWVVFDPSLKVHSRPGATAYDQASGYNSNTFMTRALSGGQSGSQSGASWVMNSNAANIAADLATYESNLRGAVLTNPAFNGLDVDALLGRVRVEGAGLGTMGGSSHPFQVSSFASWQNIPDALRTTLRVEIPNAQIDHTVFLDEYYGTRITVQSRATSFGLAPTDPCDCLAPDELVTRLYAGHTNLSQIDPGFTGGSIAGETINGFEIAEGVVETIDDDDPGSISLTLNAPYAAGAGTLHDVSFTTERRWEDQVDIFGFSGELTRQHVETYRLGVASHVNRDAYSRTMVVNVIDTTPTPHYGKIIDVRQEIEGDYWGLAYEQGLSVGFEFDVQWREWGAMRQRAIEAFNAQSGQVIRHQFTVGLRRHFVSSLSSDELRQPTPSGQAERALSMFSANSSAFPSNAIHREKRNDLPEEGTFYHAHPDTFPDIYAPDDQRLYHLPSGVSASLGMAGFAANQIAAVQQRLDDGADVWVGTEAPYSGSGGFIWTESATTGQLVFGFEELPAPETASAPQSSAASSNPDTIVGAASTSSASFDVDPGWAVLQAPSLPDPGHISGLQDRLGALAGEVDLRTGALARSEAPLVTSGPREFPYGLPFSLRRLSPAGAGNGSGSPMIEDSNFSFKASLGRGGFDVATSDDLRFAAGSLTAYRALYDAAGHSNPAVALALATRILQSWREASLLESVTIEGPGFSELFVQVAEGSYVTRGRSTSTLQQTTRLSPDSDFLALDFDLVYTNADRETIRFAQINPAQIDLRDDPRFRRVLYPAVWSFPYGVSVYFDYARKTGFLSSVSNNLGWRLEFHAQEDQVCTGSYLLQSDPDYYLPQELISANFSDARDSYDMFQSVCGLLGERAFILDRIEALYQLDQDYCPEEYRDWCRDYVSPGDVLDREIATFSLVPGNPYGTQIETPRGVFRYHSNYNANNGGRDTLREIYTPLSTSQPAVTFEYQSAPGFYPSRVTRISVRTEQGMQAFDYRISSARSQVIDPEGNGTTVYHNNEGEAVEQVSPRGISTFSVYDDRGRLVETRVAPAANPSAYESRMTYTYDLRDNRLSETAHPRAGTAGAPLTTFYTFGDPVWPHRPTAVTDPGGHESTATYHATSGLVTRTEGPSGEVSTYTYNSIGRATEHRVEVSQ